MTTSAGLRLEGRRAFVTGGGSGIGRAVVDRLMAEGAGVGVVDVRAGAAEAVAAAAGATASARGPVVGVLGDVGDEGSVEAAVAEVVAALGGIDLVVACAGITLAGTTHDMGLETWEQVLRVNLTGVFLTVKHTVPHLLSAGGGSIVTIGSVASLVAAGQSTAYDASKGGVAQFTRAVAVEYVDHGIRANCVCPGRIATDLGANSRAIVGGSAAAAAAAAAAAGSAAGSAGRLRPPADRLDVPMARAADPSEIASTVAFLCSDDAAFITGVALPVDGGYTAI